MLPKKLEALLLLQELVDKYMNATYVLIDRGQNKEECSRQLVIFEGIAYELRRIIEDLKE